MNSVRRRLTLALTVSLALLTVLGATAIYPLIHSRLLAEFDYALAAKARALTSFAESGRQGVNLQFTEAGLPEFNVGPAAEYFEVKLANGTILARSPSLANDVIPIPAQAGAWDARTASGRPVRGIVLRFPHASDGDLFVAFAKSRSDLDDTLRGILMRIIAGTAAMLAITIIVIRWAVNYGLAPVDKLARQVASASLESRIEVLETPRELQPIVRELNNLLGRLKSVFERERRFTSDAAHELITPIGELRSLTDVAIKWGDDPAATASLARTANDIALQMERTIRVLLALARSESGRDHVRKHAVELDPMLQEILRSVEPRLASKQIQLTTSFGGLKVQTDAAMMRSILFNLVDNAVDYTPPGGKIYCETDARELIIRNSQSALSPGDLDHLCEPFWRKDAARTDAAHAGLGLALAKAYSEILEIDLRLTLESGHTFAAQLSFSHGS